MRISTSWPAGMLQLAEHHFADNALLQNPELVACIHSQKGSMGEEAWKA